MLRETNKLCRNTVADPRRFVPGYKHMGEPDSFFIILKWIYKLFGINAQPGAQMSTIPFKSLFL